MRSYYDDHGSNVRTIAMVLIVFAVVILVSIAYFVYTQFRIDVPAAHIAVLTKKTGMDLENNQEVAPDESYKGLQLAVLPEGRYFYNCYTWDWEVYPMVEIPEGMLGVRIRLYGDDLPYGHFVATKDEQKGIVEDVLRPGRYALNAAVKDVDGKIITKREKQDYVEIVELHRPKTIPAGYKGVLTNLAGPIPEDPNTLLVAKGFRGVQQETLEAGTYYLNPYMYRVDSIDCRSQRFDISTGEDMGFASKDGFWITLDGIVEHRNKPGEEARTFVLFNEETNGKSGEMLANYIIDKVITPNTRSFCRLRGSNSSGRELIGGDTRVAFQTDFQKSLSEKCDHEGIEVLQALVTKINPPEQIAEPVRAREVAKQQEKQFQQEKLQQEAEAAYATEKALVEQRQKLVAAEQEVMKLVVKAEQDQQVAVEAANRDREVAIENLHAAKDKAEAILSQKKAEAAVTLYENEAEASGWKRAIESLGGDGQSYARYVLYQKLAPSFKKIMTNTADSPLMDMFKNFSRMGEDTKIDPSRIQPLKIDLPEIDLSKIKRAEKPKIENATPASTQKPAPTKVEEKPAPKAEVEPKKEGK